MPPFAPSCGGTGNSSRIRSKEYPQPQLGFILEFRADPRGSMRADKTALFKIQSRLEQTDLKYCPHLSAAFRGGHPLPVGEG